MCAIISSVIKSNLKRGDIMIRYRPGINVIGMLSDAGYNTGRIRREKVIGENALQKIRDGKLPSWNELNKLCNLLNVHPTDLLE